MADKISNPNEPPPTTPEGTSRNCKACLMSFIQNPLEYILLVRRNPRYRLYLVSHLCQHVGDWYIRIASLLLVERLAPNSASAISNLIIVKMIPHVTMSNLGGVLADSLDRRKLMICLDTLGAVVTLLFLVAIAHNSLTAFYIVTALRASVSSIYEPVTKSIVPMICPEPQDLKRANTLNGLAWSFMIAIGGIIAGRSSAYFGVEACYIIDSFTYFVSASFLLFMKGEYRVMQEEPSSSEDAKDHTDANTTKKHICSNLWRSLVTLVRMFGRVLGYLAKSGFGPLVLFKSSGSIIWGSADILNVEFAHIPNDEAATSRRLGLIFSCIGVGCLIGPIFANFATDAERPATVQLVCIAALAFMMMGWLGFAQDPSFELICFFTSVRSLGSSTIWVNSSLLLQKLSAPNMLGRVLALEFACCTFFDAFAATVAGRLVDAGIPRHTISIGVAGTAGLLFLLWSTYHMLGLGAAQKRFNTRSLEASPSSSSVAQVVFA